MMARVSAVEEEMATYDGHSVEVVEEMVKRFVLRKTTYSECFK